MSTEPSKPIPKPIETDDRKTAAVLNDIDAAFRWTTVFTDLESRGLSSLEFFLANTTAGSQIQRDIERLMEAYLNRAEPSEKALFEKAAIQRCKSFDDEDVGRLRSTLQFGGGCSDLSDRDVRQFWIDNPFRPSTVRRLAVDVGIDATGPIDRMRLDVFRTVRSSFTDDTNCGSCGTIVASSTCCNGVCIGISSDGGLSL